MAHNEIANKSRYCLYGLMLILLAINAIYYPKWKDEGKKATISYDIAGYYMYLPAAFIYNDLEKFSFRDTLNTPAIDIGTQHGREHPSGGFVFQYTSGMAIQYLPFFAMAHLYAYVSSHYPANGFSWPYQFALYFGSLMIAFLGLFYLRKLLLLFFKDEAVALVLVAIVLGTNYLTYASIKGSLTHNYLFTLYSIGLYYLVHYFRNPRTADAIKVAVVAGLAILTRPTEIIWIGLFLTWGLTYWSLPQIKERLTFFKTNRKDLLSVVLIVIGIGMIQLLYWKNATGSWLVYSYGEQGFSWLTPHIWDCLFSAKAGWITYTPMMLFVLPGIYFLYRQYPKLTVPIVSFSLLFMYITFAWDIWWYGGSLGQRAMIQLYPILAFPLAALFQKLLSSNVIVKGLSAILASVFLYLNVWYTHMAHKGGMVFPPQMTKEYLYKVIGTWDKNLNDQKLLDTHELYEGQPKGLTQHWQQTFSGDEEKIVGHGNEFYKSDRIQVNKDADWIRATVKALTHNKEWQWYNQTQLILKYYDANNQEIKGTMIRLQRHMKQGHEKDMYLDASVPEKAFDHVRVLIYNAESRKTIRIKEIVVESFNE